MALTATQTDFAESEPCLSVQIPNPWPTMRLVADRPEAASGDIRNSADAKQYPRSHRSNSNRYHSPLTTKAVAAAISTQPSAATYAEPLRRLRRERISSDGSGSSTPRNLAESRAAAQRAAADEPSTSFSPPPSSRSQYATVRHFLSKRRHERSASAPQPPSLRIDTVLPLHLPPRNLCSPSALASSADEQQAEQEGPMQRQSDQSTRSVSAPSSSTLLTALASTGSEMRRSDSLASFASAETDGSWHGDLGDSDPDAQLARALGEKPAEEPSAGPSNAKAAQSPAMPVKQIHFDSCPHGHGPLLISTEDVVDDPTPEQPEAALQTHALPAPITNSINLSASPSLLKRLDKYEMEHFKERRQNVDQPRMDGELVDEVDIQKHAGTLMSRLAATFFDVKVSDRRASPVASPDELSSDDEVAEEQVDMYSSPFERHLDRYHRSSSRLYSPSALEAEKKLIRARAQSSRSDRLSGKTFEEKMLDGEVVDEDIEQEVKAQMGTFSAMLHLFLPDSETYLRRRRGRSRAGRGSDGDDKLANDAFPRTDSLPSLISDSSSFASNEARSFSSRSGRSFTSIRRLFDAETMNQENDEESKKDTEPEAQWSFEHDVRQQVFLPRPSSPLHSPGRSASPLWQDDHLSKWWRASAEA